MSFTRSLAPQPPRYPLDVHPLARLDADGRLELLQSAFPALGRVCLVLWHPGREPAFSLHEVRLLPGWRVEPAGAAGYVVLWVSVGDPATPF